MNPRDAVYGAIAGAAGTAILNATTYADMAIRDRAPSELPQNMVNAFAHALHAPEPPPNRRQGLGALLGYADGLGVGALYGLLRPKMRNVPWYTAAAALALCTMAASEGTATAMKQTDPRSWGLQAWVADLVPRFLYGAVTVYALDLLLEA